MNYLLFFLLVTVTILSLGCKEVCECPDLLDRLSWPEKNETLYTEEAGCVKNITCRPSYDLTFVAFIFTDSEIPRPVDSNNAAGGITINPEVETGPNINIFEFFGMVCENNEWYMTKYPLGIFYGTIMDEEFVIGANGELDGKKSKIDFFSCTPWNTYEIEVKTHEVHFQTMMTYNPKTHTATVAKVVRMDRYGSTADCTSAVFDTPMCYCRIQGPLSYITNIFDWF
ncbi:hypothetical protein CRE_24830 [Caenorhabditis remanei]|uniref:DUF281 domain-containing protein n=1 Tax=Caenorhabditis remanei TaxID=31234 RepID=E3NJ28_CAERE|nr:hypothetical protein CRE_24830 [Caenorhabditis remanei]